MSIDVASLVALDVHVHAERNRGEEQDPVTGEILAAAAEYFGGHPPQPTAEEVAAYYRERNMAAVLFTVDDEAGLGRRRLGNDQVLAAAEANPDVLIPFASVDPHKGKLGVRDALWPGGKRPRVVAHSDGCAHIGLLCRVHLSR